MGQKKRKPGRTGTGNQVVGSPKKEEPPSIETDTNGGGPKGTAPSEVETSTLSKFLQADSAGKLHELSAILTPVYLNQAWLKLR